jgi:hypothetical protein
MSYLTPEPKTRRRRRLWPRTMRMRRVASLVSLALIVWVGSTAWSIAAVMQQPGNDPVSARLAEWGRDHNLGFVVTQLETLQYKLNPPKTGGAPDAKLLKPVTTVDTTIGVQPSITPLVTPALAGEGQYKTLQTVNNDAVIQVTYVRPDKVHTSYLAAVVWMSGKQTRFILHPGSTDPGHLQRWKQKPRLINKSGTGLLAAFNSGFKLTDSQGGYYENGRGSHPLVDGAASLVIYKDGHANIGAWGVSDTMTSGVASVRQNLKLLIDNGQISPNIDTAVKSNWGSTLGGTFFVWRSGIGITANGDFVYVIGDTLSAKTLAQILKRAGAVRAMQLDINKLWPSYYWYTPDGKGALVSHKVLNFERPTNRYFTTNNRDFYAVVSR